MPGFLDWARRPECTARDRTIRFMRRTADIVLTLTLALWLSLAVAGGIAAMAIFPAARELPLSMSGYEAFLAAEPPLGRQLVAGFLAERVFELTTPPRLFVGAIASLALLVQLAVSVRPPLLKLRVTAAAAAAIALAASAFLALPEFRARDAAYRSAASDAASIPQAVAMKPDVDAAHAFASRVASAEVLALLALIGLTAAAQGGSRRG